MYIKSLEDTSANSFVQRDKDKIQAGRDFVNFMKSAEKDENKSGIISLGDKEYNLNNAKDLAEYKKSLMLFAKGILDQTRDNRGKTSEEEVKLWEAAGFDKPSSCSSIKDNAKLKLFEICDFSYQENGNFISTEGNGFVDEMDLVLLMAYTDAKDGHIDGKTSLNAIKTLAAKSLIFGNSYRKDIANIMKKFQN